MERAKQQSLYDAPEWRRLLHYRGRVSEIHDRDFFFSPKGNHSAKAEMEETIDELFAPIEANVERHARCRFPARYRWLAARLSSPGEELPEPICSGFKEWARPDEIDSISVLVVSGYLGNPASTFGHALLKVNYGPTDLRELLDLSFNFGALVPPKELGPVYAVKGLFGGYNAGFSDGPYYRQDQIYVRTEFRDIWDYRLGLEREQALWLVEHLWEISGRKFTYYFTAKNCAFRLGEALALVTGEPLDEHGHVWYTPMELPDRLARANERKPGLIRSIRFIPSSQRSLYRQFSLMSPLTVAAADRVIRRGIMALDDELKPLTAEQRIDVVNALLAYYDYRVAGAQPEPPPELVQAKDRLLLERLRLPPGLPPDADVPPLPPPSAGSPPLMAGIGLGTADNRGFAGLSLSPYSADFIGQNSLEYGELVVLEAAFQLDEREGARWDRLDLFRLRRHIGNLAPIPGESRLSWRLRAALETDQSTDRHPKRALVTGGIGRSLLVSKGMLYALVDVTAQTGNAPLLFTPLLGIVTGHGRWKTFAEAGRAYDAHSREAENQFQLQARYALERRTDLRLSANHRSGQGQNDVLLSLVRTW